MEALILLVIGVIALPILLLVSHPNGGKETGGVYADPLFENAAANDFRLKPNSPAIALGFETWDYSVSGTAGGSCR